MKKIIKEETKPTININKVTDKMFIGVISNNNKSIVVSYIETDGFTRYSRMNDNFYIITSKSISILSLLSNYTYDEAYVFDTKKEMIHWLLK